MKKVALIAGAIPILLVVAIYVLAQRGVHTMPAQIACTREAKVCPDGSSVSRGGPNCEFAACPNESGAASLEPEPTPAQKVTQVAIGQTITDNDIRIAPLALVSDSRCPNDVNCIQAGTVSVSVLLKKEGETKTVTLALGESVRFAGKNVQFASVSPQPFSKVKLTPLDYRFEFIVTSSHN